MITDDIKFLICVAGVLMLVIPFMQHYSIAQEDFFELSCTNITSQVNQLLESKGPVQRNMLDLKNMTFLMNLYNMKCA
jgi:hypothetical protein